jgi:hypothetical protein
MSRRQSAFGRREGPGAWVGVSVRAASLRSPAAGCQQEAASRARRQQRHLDLGGQTSLSPGRDRIDMHVLQLPQPPGHQAINASRRCQGRECRLGSLAGLRAGTGGLKANHRRLGQVPGQVCGSRNPSNPSKRVLVAVDVPSEFPSPSHLLRRDPGLLAGF